MIGYGLPQHTSYSALGSSMPRPLLPYRALHSFILRPRAHILRCDGVIAKLSTLCEPDNCYSRYTWSWSITTREGTCYFAGSICHIFINTFFHCPPLLYGLRRLKLHRTHILCHLPNLPHPLYCLYVILTRLSFLTLWKRLVRLKRAALRDIMFTAFTMRGGAYVESSVFARIVRQIVAGAGKGSEENAGEGTLQGGKPSIVLFRAFRGIHSVFTRYTYVEGIGSYAARGYHGSTGK